MLFKTSVAFFVGLVAQEAIATGWTDASAFSCPGNTNNHCSPSQQGGYSWSGLGTGSFSSYGSNQFSGFTCSNSFGKRDLLTKRSFQSKCITGNLDDSPSMSGGSFSINQMQISSSHDADIECHYGMPDGSTCTETHSCSSGGSIFQNTQCGGATSVTFKPGKNAPSGCSIGVHSVGFHCSSASSPPSTPTTSVTAQSAPPTSPPTQPSSPPPCYGGSCTTSAPPPPPPPPSTTTPSSPGSPPCYGGQCSRSPSSPVQSSPPSTPSGPPCYGNQCSTSVSAASSSPPSPPCYGKQCSTPVAPTTSSPPSPPCYGNQCSTSVSPASSSPPSPPCYGGQCSSPPSSPASPTSPASTGPSPPCYGPSCSGASTSPVVPASVSPPAHSPSPPQPYQPNCPDVLPRCLKTWMFVTNCKDNSDSSCFCENETLIKQVMACLSAWSTSSSDTSAAASYLMGLCADHVPNNPAIITACPSGVTPGPTPPVSAQGTPPCTTITYSSSVVVPATYSTGVSAGFTCPGSSVTTNLVTTVTVPQVSLTTSTVTVAGQTSCSVGLGGGSPNSATAWTTAPTPSPPATPASASPVFSTPAPPPYASSPGSTLGTSYGTSWATSATASSSPLVPATGVGVKLGSGLTGLAVAAIAALAAL